MKKKTFIPISALMGALLLALFVGVFSASPFGERNVAYAQTASEDSTLASLVLMYGNKEIKLTPASGTGFNRADPSVVYTATVPNRANSLRINARSNITGAQVQIYTGPGITAGANGTGAIADTATLRSASSVPIATPPADTVIGIKVTSTGNVAGSDPAAPSVSVYQITVTRLAAGLSSDAKLAATGGLSLDTTVDGTAAASDAADAVALSPDFKPNVGIYTARVANSVDSVEVVAAAANDDARPVVTAESGRTVTDDDVLTDNDVAVGVSDLQVGANVITIKVTAANLEATKTYKVTVTRAAVNASNDARLSRLSLSNLTLSPAFDIDRASRAYDVNAPHRISQTTVTPIVNDSGAKARVISPDDFNTSTTAHEVALGVGPTTITIEVTAEDAETSLEYMVTVTRAPAGASNNAKLAATGGLSLDTDTADNAATPASGITLSPGFKPDIENYTARVANSVTSLEVIADAEQAGASLAVTAEKGRTVGADADTDTADDNAVAIDVGDDAGSLKEGANVITIKVTAADLVATKTYTVTVTRAATNTSDDTRLSALMVGSESVDTSAAGKGGALSAPTAEDAAVNHTTGVGSDVDSIAISATPNHSGAIVNIFAAAVAADAAVAHDTGTPVGTDGMAKLSVDRNIVRIQVTAENGSHVRNYFVEINRASAGASGNAKLAATGGLSLDTDTADNAATPASGITLSPGFKPDIENYTARVANSVTSLEVIADAEQAGASLAVTAEKGRTVGADADTDTADDNAVAIDVGDDAGSLKEGANVITIKVTAADLVTTKTYTVTVTRAATNASDDTRLSALMVGSESVDTSAAGKGGAFSAPTAEDAAVNHTTGVPNGVSSIAISATPNHSGAIVNIFAAAVAADAAVAHDTGTPVGTDGMAKLSVGRNIVRIQVTAENASHVRNYFVDITRAAANASGDAKLDELTLSSVTLSPIFSDSTMMYSAEVPVNITSTTVIAVAADTAKSVVIMSDTDDTLGEDLHEVSDADVAYGTSHSIDLSLGDNVITIMVTAEDYATMETYTVTIQRGPSNNAKLSSLSLTDDMGMGVALVAGVAAHWNTLDCPEMNDRVGADDQPDNMNSPYCRMYDGLDDAAKAVVDAAYEEDPIEGFMSDIDMYYASVDGDVEMVTVSAMAMDSDSTVSGDGAVSLDTGENTITVTVTAEDGTTMMTYTIMVTVGDPPPISGGDLLERYDADDSGHIDSGEAAQAVIDFQNGDLSREDAVQVILLYHGS